MEYCYSVDKFNALPERNIYYVQEPFELHKEDDFYISTADTLISSSFVLSDASADDQIVFQYADDIGAFQPVLVDETVSSDESTNDGDGNNEDEDHDDDGKTSGPSEASNVESPAASTQPTPINEQVEVEEPVPKFIYAGKPKPLTPEERARRQEKRERKAKRYQEKKLLAPLYTLPPSNGQEREEVVYEYAPSTHDVPWYLQKRRVFPGDEVMVVTFASSMDNRGQWRRFLVLDISENGQYICVRRGSRILTLSYTSPNWRPVPRSGVDLLYERYERPSYNYWYYYGSETTNTPAVPAEPQPEPKYKKWRFYRVQTSSDTAQERPPVVRDRKKVKIKVPPAPSRPKLYKFTPSKVEEPINKEEIEAEINRKAQKEAAKCDKFFNELIKHYKNVMPIYELPRIPRVNKQPPIQSIAEQMAYYTHETTVTTDAAATTTTTTTKESEQQSEPVVDLSVFDLRASSDTNFATLSVETVTTLTNADVEAFDPHKNKALYFDEVPLSSSQTIHYADESLLSSSKIVYLTEELILSPSQKVYYADESIVSESFDKLCLIK